MARNIQILLMKSIFSTVFFLNQHFTPLQRIARVASLLTLHHRMLYLEFSRYGLKTTAKPKKVKCLIIVPTRSPAFYIKLAYPCYSVRVKRHTLKTLLEANLLFSFLLLYVSTYVFKYSVVEKIY